MKRTISIPAASILVTILYGGILFAAPRMQGHGGYHYDPAKITTVQGVISAIDTTARGWGKQPGTHLTLNTGKESVEVYLGPTWFLEGKISLAKGDSIEVTGARAFEKEITGIFARTIKKGNTLVTLRKEDGTPLWSGEGKRL